MTVTARIEALARWRDARRDAIEANVYDRLLDCGFTEEQARALARTETTVFLVPSGRVR